jgi:hypothetical protein
VALFFGVHVRIQKLKRPGEMHVIDSFERNLIGAVLLDNSRWEQASKLTPDDFSLDSHRRIFAALTALADRDAPLSLVTLGDELDVAAVGGQAYLAVLMDGVVIAPAHVQHCAKRIRQAAGLRHIARVAEAIMQHASDPAASIPDIRARLAELLLTAGEYEMGDSARIRTFEDIPDIFKADISDVSYVVPGLVPEGFLTLMAGEPGIGKSFLALRLAVSCAMGTRFLSRDCTRVPVLYLDRENPGAIVRQRVQSMADGPVPGLKIWGGWLKDGVPALDDPRLLTIAKEPKPLIIVDSLIRFHDGEENSASEMSKVLAKLRALANAGATVFVIHHRGKGEGAADYRGSSDIGGGPDVVYTLTRDDGGLLTLKHVKNRACVKSETHDPGRLR